jgi:hypothetical protein
MPVLTTLLITGGVGAAALAFVNRTRRRLQRDNFIRSYMFPRGLFEKLVRARPGLEVKDQQLVARALRQFFLAYHRGGYRRVAMPSQVVDELWHEFILFTRDYQDFCRTAFGRFLHHTPATALGAARRDNEGLRRVWWFSCLEENINPRRATRLPLLFAIDRKLGIRDGFVYELHCGRAPGEVRDAAAGAQCADAFGDSSIDGSTAGFGCVGDSHGAQGGHAGGDTGCSGGCGGGCGGD